ncbi:(2Fe-2S) ferredoxin domain-containing protein [Sulfurospirillum arcachonense]|uniref:(2Fe-2S) ferredoxin domain-containing protein n=1 Tax=Sulfurospirillum arcachonense TaxID=57666 RepID=UPI00046A209A|nr:ferredoxin [Sulfurospirillum arcachonense]
MGIPQPAFYIFKCEQSSPPGMPKPSCVNEITRELYQYMSNKLMVLGITTTVHPIRTACLNRCQMGPVMLVEPGHHMYIGLTKEKIDKIIDEHIIKGIPVQEYIIPEEFWDKAISPAKMMEMEQRV